MATCPSGHESADDDFCDVCGFAIGPAAVPVDHRRDCSRAVPELRHPPRGTVLRGVRLRLHRLSHRGGARAAGDQSRARDCPAAGGPPPARSVPPPVRPPRPSHPARPPGQPAAPPAPIPSAAATVPPASAALASTARAPVAPPPGPPDGGGWTAVVTADRDYYDSVQANGGPGAEGISFPVYCPQRRFRLAGAEVRVGRRSAHSGIDPEIDLTGPPADPGVSRLHAVLLRDASGSWSVVDPGSANGTLVNGSEIARDQIVPLHDGDRIHLGAWTELRIVSEG